jgi:hypothetical protein
MPITWERDTFLGELVSAPDIEEIQPVMFQELTKGCKAYGARIKGVNIPKSRARLRGLRNISEIEGKLEHEPSGGKKRFRSHKFCLIKEMPVQQVGDVQRNQAPFAGKFIA